jgi:hypothetical protein
MSLDQVRAVADAVLYEGYLLYPYRSTAQKNQLRWQFGVLGPPGAGGEEPDMTTGCLLTGRPTSVRVHLRFLHLQTRSVERYDGRGDRFEPVEQLTVGDRRWVSFEEAVEAEVQLERSAAELARGTATEVTVDRHLDVEMLTAGGPGSRVVGRIVRRRHPLRARVAAATAADEGFTRLEVRVENLTDPATAPDARAATGLSLVGAHLVLEAVGARFVSVVDPPPAAVAAAGRCRQHRCWPVLAGEHADPAPGEGAGTSTVVLAAPIILYDFPEVAGQSSGALFDSTEIDEILTLRVQTMTAQEKAEARATDPRAAEIVDRCDQLSAADLQQLHGVLHNPHDPEPELPWWDPAADAAVRPESDTVVIDGVPVGNGSLVRVHPTRRADAQDLFFAGRVARVTAVLSDVDGAVHVALVLVDDPAADLHDWYGRYWYFAPDELEPLPGTAGGQPPAAHREESRP